MHRRSFLAIAALPLVAGCLDDDVEDDPQIDDEDDGANGTDEDTDPEDEDDGVEEVGDEPENGDEPDETVQFGEVIRFADAFAFEYEGTTDGERVTGSGRVAGEDSHWEMAGDDGVWEMYLIGQDLYIVENGQCFRMSQEEHDQDQEVGDPEAPEEEVEEHPELESVGRETIDDEEMYVFELAPDESTHQDTTVTYYVSVETGYLRRMEYDDTVMDFHSWGEVDEIEPPDIDCVDLDEWEGNGPQDRLSHP